jgi:hypothetical protein
LFLSSSCRPRLPSTMRRQRSLAPFPLSRQVPTMALLLRWKPVGLCPRLCTGIWIDFPNTAASETVGPGRSRVEPSRFLFIHSSEPSKGKFLERSGVMSHCLQGYHKSQPRSRLKLLSYRVPAPALKYDTPPPRAVGRSSLKSGRNGIDEHSKGSLNKLDHKIGDRHSEMGSCNPLISERSQTSLSLVRHFQHPELGLDATKLDPFSTTSAPITRDMQILLEFCRCRALNNGI